MTPRGETLLLATRSAHKVREIRDVLGSDLAARLQSLAEAGIEELDEEEAIEAFPTFRENALAKARYFARRTGRPTLADDSGLCVHALDGAPGVHSRRFAAGSFRGHAQDEANNHELLRRLRNVPPEQRTAHYLCAATLVHPDGPEFTALGSCSGAIAAEPAGDGGFGFDPLFLLPDLGLTFGQVPAAEKQRRSHRARAFRALRSLIG
jgi:XTP/dITP diphosphohydrolase